MLDVLFVIATIVFFVIAILYTYGCEWFVKDQKTIATGQIQTTREQSGPPI